MKKFIIYTDGGSRGNPGLAAIGVVIQNEKEQELKKYGEYLGDNLTNNEAEYRAVIFGLQKFKVFFGKKLAQNSEVELKSDSELLINQLNGEYKVLEPGIQKLFIAVWNLKTDFKKIKFALIPREKNKEADDLVNEALDSGKFTQKLL